MAVRTDAREGEAGITTVLLYCLYRCPQALVGLLEAGLLPADYPVPMPVRESRRQDWEALMAHDSYRRMRGAIRQVRWVG